MKKLIIALMGLFMFVSCSEDAYQEADEQNSLNVENNNSTNDGTASNMPFTVAPDYSSPFDILEAGNPRLYKFTNYTGDLGASSPTLLTLRVTPYVGLAYYDGKNDGLYNNNIPITSGYPNLYPTGATSEVGKFIPTASFTMTGTGIPFSPTAQLEVISSTDHCPLANNTAGTLNPGPTPIFFNPFIVNPAEIALLKQYGKVFFYWVEVINPGTGLPVFSRFMMPDSNPAVFPTDWSGPIASVPVLGLVPPVPMYRNNSSNEVVLNIKSLYPGPNPPQYGSLYDFTFNGYNIRAELNSNTSATHLILNNF